MVMFAGNLYEELMIQTIIHGSSSLGMERSAMAATGITFQNTQNQPPPKLSGITFHSFIKTTNFPNSTSKNIVEITVDSNVSSSLQRYTHS